MNLAYYPGCTLKTNGKHFEDSAMQAMEALGFPLKEMEKWVCCGTVFSMATDDLMMQLGAIRNLLRAQEQNIGEVVTLCSMCYNTLQQANHFVSSDAENLEKVNDIMYKEKVRYEGNVEILHLLPILRDRITFQTLKQKIQKPLQGLKIGSYYGCLLLRPKEFAIDDFEAPTIMEDLLRALGAEPIDFPYQLECCGAYQTVTHKDVTAMRTYEIVNSAQRSGCDALITSCPLCAFNLDKRQRQTAEKKPGFEKMPIFYFTELLALALQGQWDEGWTAMHYVNPEPLLHEKQLI